MTNKVRKKVGGLFWDIRRSFRTSNGEKQVVAYVVTLSDIGGTKLKFGDAKGYRMEVRRGGSSFLLMEQMFNDVAHIEETGAMPGTDSLSAEG